MPICPKCASSRVKTNKPHDESAKRGVHAAHLARHAGGAGPLAMLVAGVGTWLLGKAVDAGQNGWKCDSCGHEF